MLKKCLTKDPCTIFGYVLPHSSQYSKTPFERVFGNFCLIIVVFVLKCTPFEKGTPVLRAVLVENKVPFQRELYCTICKHFIPEAYVENEKKMNT